MTDQQITQNINFNSLSKDQIIRLYNVNMGIIGQLTLEIGDLRMKNEELKKDKEKYYEIIEENKKLIKEHENNIIKLQEENIKLNDKIQSLENHINNQDDKILSLGNELSKMKKEKERFDALVRLHECNALVNKNFKTEYKKTFKPKRNEYIPNIGDIINDPPIKDDDEEYYNFWENFKSKYPGSDDIRFRKIYFEINNDRSNCGAHINISYLGPDEFDKLIILAYPEKYKNNPNLYKEYRDWLFQFPAI